jgi:hypothetical protein
MAHPFARYAELASIDDAEALGLARSRPLLLLGAIGAVVSLTSAGRLVAAHVVFTMLFWAFLPALQALAMAAATRLVAREIPLGRALGLQFVGHGPWLFFLLLLAAVPLFAPNVYAAFTSLLRVGVLPGALVVALGWAGVLTYACFREGLGLSRRRAAGGTAAYYLAYFGAIVGYYFLTNQLQPQLFGVPA